MSRNSEAKPSPRRADGAPNCAEQESVGLLPELETGPIGSLPIYRPFVSDRPMTHADRFGLASSFSADLDDDFHDIVRSRDRPRAMRQLGSVEHLLWLVDQQRPLHFAVTAHVSGRTKVAAWRNALDQLQRRHSLMSVGIVGEPGRVPYFQQGSAAGIPLRVVHGDPTAHWENEVAAELANPFGADDVPLIRAVLIHADRDAALILVAHHAIADGMSLAYAIRDTLTALAGNTLAPLPPTPSEDDLLLAARPSTSPVMTNEMPQGQASGVPIKWRARDDARPPTVHGLVLPRALTARLRDRARGESATVHCALAAALVIGARELAPDWRDIPVRVWSPVNVRRVLDGAGEHCGDFVSSASSVFTTEGDFWPLARKVKEDIEPARTREGLEAALSGIQAFLRAAPGVKAAADFATSTTKRPRRVGWFEWDQFRKACVLNAPTDIVLTFADYIDGKNRDARRFEQLSQNTIKFIEELERVSQAPVSLINTRFARDENRTVDLRSIIDRRNWTTQRNSTP